MAGPPSWPTRSISTNPGLASSRSAQAPSPSAPSSTGSARAAPSSTDLHGEVLAEHLRPAPGTNYVGNRRQPGHRPQADAPAPIS
ncbi:MAG: hypothetical protein EPN43_04480 [Jatrophihabitans sp.]|nr:MAG: hypothetical protein EPN43_04480 [Jatrophihabitans sp.]